MPSWLVVPLIVALALPPGVLIVARFLPRGSRWGLPLGFAALALGLLATGWLALLLAELVWFGLWTLLAVWLVLLALLLGWHAAARRTTAGEATAVTPQSPLATWEWLVLGAWLLAAIWLFFRPHEYILGGADAGVYISLAAEIAKQGGVAIVDPDLAALDPTLRDAVLRPLPNTPGADSYLMPGFYVTDAARGAITPQFFPLHPVWQAVAFALAGGAAGGVSATEGVGAALLLPGLWMLLATLAIFLLAREIGGPETAVLTLAGLSLMALQVWFARYPTTEALTQFLLWTGLWAVSRWLGGKSPARLWALLAGAALGTSFLVRIDLVVVVPVYALLLVWRYARGWQPDDTWFAAPLVALGGHALLHAHFLSAPYFYETMGYALRVVVANWPLLLVALAAAGLFLWAVRRFSGRVAALGRYQRAALALLIGAILVFAAYGWWVRPSLFVTTLRPDAFSGGSIPVTNHENWPRLGWYLSPLGLGLGVLGSCLLLWRVNRKTAVLLAVGLLFSALYLWNIRANPHHVYAMRRYVPVVAPFFIFSAAYLLGNLVGQLRRVRERRSLALGVGGVLLALLWLGGLGWSARGFVSQVDYAGLTEQLAGLDAQLPPDAVLLFVDQAPVGLGDIWGTPLRFVYGRTAFTLRDPDVDPAQLAQTIELWQNNGRSVVWIGASDWLDAQGLPHRTQEVILSSTRLESSYAHKPQAIVPATWTLRLNFLESES